MRSIIVKVKPTSPGLRGKVVVKHPFLFKGGPWKPLVQAKKNHAGRNNAGRITVRHMGGGHKKSYRIIDFKRDKIGILGTVERIEYDPNRTAFIALICYPDGERRYILWPKGLKVGQKIMSDIKTPVEVGNCMSLRNMPLGSLVHCIEMRPKKGAQICRGAGCFSQLVAKDTSYASLRLSSGEIRRIFIDCKAVIGEVGNSESDLAKLGKAGTKRWRNIRPTVRGVAMNPVDHPHGGGEGKTSGGRHPVSPWGVLTKGFKTRNKKKSSSAFIVRRRK